VNALLALIMGSLLAVMLLGLWRLFRGPDDADRVLGVQLVGSIAVAVSIMASIALDVAGLFDLALVLAVLTAVTVIALVQRVWRQSEE
jgi:multicomponent Na+:H+ antiporter subunit F